MELSAVSDVRPIFSSFPNYQAESAIIGRILTGFGDVEYQLARCTGLAIGNFRAAFRALFRLTGGDVRLQVADALMRPAYEKIGLKNEYEAMLGAFRHLKTIRNQYAHAHFMQTEKDGLFFTDMQQPAKTSAGLLRHPMRHLDVPLLEKQEYFAIYVSDWLWFLDYEYCLRDGQIPSHDWKAPKIIDLPLLHNLPEEHPFPTMFSDNESPPTAESFRRAI